jgi:hypothetical protein
MAIGAYRGVMRGGMAVPREGETPLTDGTEVVVTAVIGPPGSAAAVLAAVETSPRVPAEWVDELEQVIARSRQPLSRSDPFADVPGGRENP